MTCWFRSLALSCALFFGKGRGVREGKDDTIDKTSYLFVFRCSMPLAVMFRVGTDLGLVTLFSGHVKMHP